MDHNISYYRKIHGTYGVRSAKEAEIRAARHAVQKAFTRTLNWEYVSINGDDERELQIIPTQDLYTKKVKARPEEVICLGDIVNWRDGWWIVNTLDADDQINYQGTMVQCNTVLRWQLDDGSIHEEYGWDKDGSKYSFGEDHSQYMDTPDFVMKVIVQVNEHTLTIRRNKRFLLGQYGAGLNPLAVEVSRINGITNTYEYSPESSQYNSGLLEITLHETQFKEGIDNVELGVADYKEPLLPTEVVEDEGGWL